MKDDNLPIGYINVRIDDSYELGYGLRKEFWHKGIVTEAGKARYDVSLYFSKTSTETAHDKLKCIIVNDYIHKKYYNDVNKEK